MDRAFRACVLLLGLHGITGSRVEAQSGTTVAATECCTLLHTYVGARAVGLGNAITARSGSDALFVNPAGLAGLARDELRIHNAPTEIYESTTFGVAFRVRDVGVFGISYRLIDAGELPATGTGGETTGALRYLDHSLLASFATNMSAGLTGGISYKLYQTRADCRGFCEEPGFVGTTHGIDAGVQYHPRLWRALQLGASLLHMGLPLQIINAPQSDPMPTRLRAGVAYEALHHFSPDSTNALWLSADASIPVLTGRGERVVGIGAELIIDRIIFVRGGYSTGTTREAGFGVGVGLQYDRFDVGIAKTFVQTQNAQDAFQVTFAIGF